MSLLLPRRTAIAAFLAFALSYFMTALLRAITATLAPVLQQEFGLPARDLGLLAGGYFLGFALVQLPLGGWLDRHGPRKVLLALLGVAVLGCLVFARADGFAVLLLGRVLCGVGVGACLMAPLAGFRRWLEPGAQLRVNAWLLMTGSLGMVAATLPVQWLLPLTGWRALFGWQALLLALAMGVLALCVPRWTPAPGAADAPQAFAPWRSRYFMRLLPLGFWSYGGMVAMQTLWAVPWMQHVAGYTPLQAATGLFWINVSMLCAFAAWGWVSPWLLRRLGSADPLLLWGQPLALLALAAIVLLGPGAGALAWALFCVASSHVVLSQPALAQALPEAVGGRALAAYNLAIYAGVFAVQWGIGVAVDACLGAGLAPLAAYRTAMAGYWLCGLGAYLWFVACGRRGHNAADTRPS